MGIAENYALQPDLRDGGRETKNVSGFWKVPIKNFETDVCISLEGLLDSSDAEVNVSKKNGRRTERSLACYLVFIRKPALAASNKTTMRLVGYAGPIKKN